MIENPSESIVALGLLLIFVIGVLHMLQTTSRTSMEITPPVMTMKPKKKTINKHSLNRTPRKMTAGKLVFCKKCQTRVEWLTKRDCENPECTCPEVQKLRKVTQEVIEKAQQTAAQNVQQIRRNTPPTGYLEDVPQYMVDVPDVMVIDVIVPKTNFGHKRK